MIHLVVTIAFLMGGQEAGSQEYTYTKPFTNAAECEDTFGRMQGDLVAYVRGQYSQDVEVKIKGHTCGVPGEDV